MKSKLNRHLNQNVGTDSIAIRWRSGAIATSQHAQIGSYLINLNEMSINRREPRSQIGLDEALSQLSSWCHWFRLNYHWLGSGSTAAGSQLNPAIKQEWNFNQIWLNSGQNGERMSMKYNWDAINRLGLEFRRNQIPIGLETQIQPRPHPIFIGRNQDPAERIRASTNNSIN